MSPALAASQRDWNDCKHFDDQDGIDEQHLVVVPILRGFAYDEGIGVKTKIEGGQVDFLATTGDYY